MSDRKRTQRDRALAYAKHGWHVLPVHTVKHGVCTCNAGARCRSPGKHPKTQHGVKDATINRKRIREWFEVDPDANIAIAMGGGSGLLALDIDPRNEGDATLKRLQLELGPLPDTVEARTGGAGRHLIFAHPGTKIRKDSAGKLLGPGVDVMSDGSFIVVPRSRHKSGKHYTWAGGPETRTLAKLPQRWRERLEGQPSGEASTLTEPSGSEPIPQGRRNTELTSLVGKLHASGIARGPIRAAAGEVNKSRCTPPLSDEELDKIIASVTGYPPGRVSADPSERILTAVLRQHFAGGDHLIFGPDGRFWRYDGKKWAGCPDKWLEGRILETIRGDTATVQNTSAQIAQVHRLLQADRAIADDRLAFTADPQPVINCGNGELWGLDDGKLELRPHSPGSFLRHCLSVEYDSKAQCPNFDRALKSIFQEAGDAPDMIRHWHELVGYWIQPSRRIPLITILSGSGANGKTSLIQTVVRLLGKDQVMAMGVQELDQSRFTLGALLDKFLLVDDDVKAGIRLPDGTLKKISEAKTLTGERKHGDHFTFTCRALPILLCNNPPSLADVSPGMTRRLMVIPFEHRFTKQDKDKELFPRIWGAEMPGVLNRAIEGYRRLAQRKHEFEEPKAVQKAKKAWIKQANPLPAFIQEKCRKTAAGRCSIDDLYRAYCDWADANGFTLKQQRNKLSTNLAHLGFESKHANQGTVVLGIELR